MLKDLKIPATHETPKVEFIASRGQLTIEGESLAEDIRSFYAPLQEWLSQYAKEPAELTELHFNLEYYNSSTARQIMEIIFILEEIKNKQAVKVIWTYQKDDLLMKENGEEIQSIVDVPFELKQV
jgi:hypothetical protein